MENPPSSSARSDHLALRWTDENWGQREPQLGLIVQGYNQSGLGLPWTGDDAVAASNDRPVI
ncbi:hypothetical protein N7492_005248 [Penicillium capsulatum]|uniref:Uncharacterized protein n=1 Tax=Penicillium capsulatum TaxID=69766 RepID=A0A9W9IBX5_9EURO|nr:hypothetical protein N7492_005248 [Penicillium capsulatum]